MKTFFRRTRNDWLMLLFWCAISFVLFLLPEPPRLAKIAGESFRAEVIEVDNSDLQTHGLLKFGTQNLHVKILSGPRRGETHAAANEIRAQMELDKEFYVGDAITVAVPEGNADVLTAQDHDRRGWMFALFGGFCLLLVVFGGMTGVKALASFVFSCVVIWRAVIPLLLCGWDPLWVSFAAVALLTLAIMFLVAGFTRKGVAAFAGAMLGIFFGVIAAQLFTVWLHINGATMPYAQALLYSGYETLDLGKLFAGAMILASSGAVMDLAMDIAAGVEEVNFHHPGLPFKLLFWSGVRIGRSVVGTMTTTLLLAYSGGYITLLMMFYAQGTPSAVFLNNPLVASEIVKTLIGSFGLLLVAPFTALTAAWCANWTTTSAKI